MAYLRGGTVVDGPLYVEGDIKVKRVVVRDGSGYFPYVVGGDGNDPDVIVKFQGSAGDLANSNLKQTYDENNGTVNIGLFPSNISNNKLLINVDPSRLLVPLGTFSIVAKDSDETTVSDYTTTNADLVDSWNFSFS